MAKKKTKTTSKKTKKFKAPSFKLSSQQKLVFGSLLIILGLLLFIAFLSFFFTGEADQSTLSEFTSRNTETQNWLSKSGAWLSDFFIQRGFWYSLIYIFWINLFVWSLCVIRFKKK